MGYDVQGKRPGGLTALAVLNFVFGGLGAIGILALIALLGLADKVVREGTRGEKGLHDAPGAGLVYLAILMSVVSIALLITSGVGYLLQKKFLGKMLGNAYGILGLISTAIGVAISSEFNIGTIIGLIYPVLTLALLNTVFKDDFPNP
jgi:hypothetical protein